MGNSWNDMNTSQSGLPVQGPPEGPVHPMLQMHCWALLLASVTVCVFSGQGKHSFLPSPFALKVFRGHAGILATFEEAAKVLGTQED